MKLRPVEIVAVVFVTGAAFLLIVCLGTAWRVNDLSKRVKNLENIIAEKRE